MNKMMLGETGDIYSVRSVRSRTPAADSEVTEQQELDEVFFFTDIIIKVE